MNAPLIHRDILYASETKCGDATFNMKRFLTLFLQAITVLIGISAFIFLLWEPQIEGRNANATLFEIYFKDPFLVYAYSVSTLFFVALYQIYKVLGYIRQNKTFSQATLNALSVIQYCAISIIGFVTIAVACLFIVRPGDDIAGGVFMGVFIIFILTVIALGAILFERKLRKTISAPSFSRRGKN